MSKSYVPFLVLDLALDVVDGIGRLNLEGDGLASERLDENLHVVVVVVIKDIEDQMTQMAVLYIVSLALSAQQRTFWNLLVFTCIYV